MYSEMSLIKAIPSRRTRVAIALQFIEEYGGWATHIANTGLTWGTANEETAAGRELVRCQAHLSDLKQFVLNEMPEVA